MNHLERWARQGESPVNEKRKEASRYLSRAGHVKPGLNLGGPPSKAKYDLMTDREEYREGKMKRTPVRGVK